MPSHWTLPALDTAVDIWHRNTEDLAARQVSEVDDMSGEDEDWSGGRGRRLPSGTRPGCRSRRTTAAVTSWWNCAKAATTASSAYSTPSPVPASR
ncbi:hypothetical protein K7G98_31120, partial [Saccharothrix sp. MB29]|nr:hypothetical protein [Saccharothrix sp. MB29]